MLDQHKIIEAAGGGSHVRTIEDARKFNAFVKIRPVSHRKDLFAILMPEYEHINV